MVFRSRARRLQWASNRAEAVTGLIPGSLAAIIHDLDLPVVVATPATPVVSAHDEAVVLLQIASEVEHAFLLQYLYAAYSLNQVTGGAAAGQLVEVAEQEMAHLITVQNLLIALGKPVALNREDFPKHPDLFPFPAALEPVTSDSLAKYVTAESPALDDIKDPADHATAVAAATQIAQTVPNVHRVGAIYAALYWLFQPDDQAQGPWALEQAVIDQLIAKYGAGFHLKDTDFADPTQIANCTANSVEWGVGDPSMHLDPGFPRAAALAAIATIAQQGEGPTISPTMPSHFQVFIQMYRSFPQWPADSVLDVPVNPRVVPPQSPDAGSANAITNTSTSTWATLLNVRYRMLVVDILIGMSLDRTKDAALRTTIFQDWAVAHEMQEFIATIAQNLTGKFRGSGTDRPKFAGATFELGDVLPDTPCGRWKEQSALIQQSVGLITTLGTPPGLSASEKQLLIDMTTFDTGRKSVIDAKIKDLCG